MKPRMCPEELAVARAARTGQWNDLLRDHAARCATCREVLQATRWMGSLAQASDERSTLPAAERVWCAALLAQKQADVERAQRPLLLAEMFIAMLGLAAVSWLAWHGLEIGFWLTDWFARGLLPQPWTGLATVSPVRPALSAALAALVLTIVALLVAQPLLGED